MDWIHSPLAAKFGIYSTDVWIGILLASWIGNRQRVDDAVRVMLRDWRRWMNRERVEMGMIEMLVRAALQNCKFMGHCGVCGQMKTSSKHALKLQVVVVWWCKTSISILLVGALIEWRFGRPGFAK